MKMPNYQFRHSWNYRLAMAGWEPRACASVCRRFAPAMMSRFMRVANEKTGGHLAFRCAFDKRVAAAVSYFATDIHSRSLGEGKQDDSLERAGDIKGEVVMVGLDAIMCSEGFRLSFDRSNMCQPLERSIAASA